MEIPYPKPSPTLLAMLENHRQDREAIQQVVRGGEQKSFAYNSKRHQRRAAEAKARKAK